MVGLFFHEKGYQLVRRLFGILDASWFHDYENVVHAGQAIITRLKIPSLYSNYSQNLSTLNIKKNIFSLEFESPITFAAFESHLDSLMLWHNLGCGGGCLKTIKLAPESGNPRPRMQRITLEGKEHLMNALGLPGPGVKSLIHKLKSHPIRHVTCPIGVSIGGHTLSEYNLAIQDLLPFIESQFRQPYLELNISCPNTDTGQSLHDNLSELETLIKLIRDKSSTIVIVIKVSPDATNNNLCDIASLAKQSHKVTINAGNTQFKSAEDVGLCKKKISIGGGGISGPFLFNRTLEMAKILKPYKLPIISTGGISTKSQIDALMDEGVTVIGMATQLVKNPFSVVKLNESLSKDRQQK